MEDKQQAEARKEIAAKIVKSLETSMDQLDPYERRLGTKMMESRAIAEKVLEDIKILKGQVNQAQARIRSLELQLENAVGKASGLLETLVDMYMESAEEAGDSDPQSDTEKTETVHADQGDQDEKDSSSSSPGSDPASRMDATTH